MINVYCASAGSGKTHLLTGYYLTLLLRRDWTPDELRRMTEYYEVLAVTFTNKATAEMKERIIAELHRLAKEPEKSDYLKEILHEEEVGQLQKRAKVLLEKMLCDYSNFNVSTIDRFFQKVIRAFMRELDLPSGYEVQLDDTVVLDAAVARFLNDLERGCDPSSGEMSDEYNWVRSFSQNNIAEGKEWDVQKAIRSLANQITTEEYQAYRESIQTLTNDKALLDAYRKQLKEIKEDYENDLKTLGEAFVEWVNKNIPQGMDAFKGKSRSPLQIFNKWANGNTDKYAKTFTDLFEDSSKCFNKGYPAFMTSTLIEELEQFLSHAKTMFGEPYIRYNSAYAILSQLYQLGTLANVDEAVRQYCSDQCMVLIGNTNALLAKLVEGDDSPFVYAKVGTRYRSFMIDEFQDTSGMQWNNFLPLLRESNSMSQRNLIVGDVKQSIYRFRGSDWSLLQSGLQRDFPHYAKNPTVTPPEADSMLLIDTEKLRINWRSLQSLVWFNNHFFDMAAHQMSDNLSRRLIAKADKSKGTPASYEPDPMGASKAHIITDIYADVQQKYRPSKEDAPLAIGLTEIRYLTPSTIDDKEEDYDTCAARLVPETVRQLLDNGFALRDIAILGRKNEQCQAVAEACLAAGFPIISNKALRLDSNDAISAIIALMRHLQHPHDKLLRAIAGFEFNALLDRQGDMGEVINCYFDQQREQQEQLNLQSQSEQNPQHKDTPVSYLFPELPELANKPLYELLEGLISLLPVAVQQEDTAFLQALRDQAIQFIAQRTPDLSAFLEWYDESGYKTNIATPEGEDAIQIMTIHQSKGLGMPAVIYPFATGSLDIEMPDRGNHPSILWCKPKDVALQVPQRPGSKSITPAFPITRSAKLKDTDFAEEYLQERLCSIIDELNTAYVAYTRAKEALIIYTRKVSLDDNQLYSQEKVLRHFHTEAEALLQDADIDYDIQDNRITLGQWQRAKKREETVVVKENPAPSEAHSPLPRLSMRQSRIKSNSEAVRRGNEMHERLEQIVSINDIRPEDADLWALIHTDALTESWFAPDLIVYNEQPIVLPSGIEKRPDRIIVDAAGRCTVIDYKTSQLDPGQTHKPEHVRQVQIYMSLLRSMFNEVQGYLWYLSMGTHYKVTADTRGRR